MLPAEVASRAPSTLVLCALAALAGACGRGPRTPGIVEPDLARIFADEGTVGTIVIRRQSDGREWVHDPTRAERRYFPASTFKIAHSLIALETGVVRDVDQETFAWDGVKRGGAWDQDQTLRSAFERSAVWVYQELARRIGRAASAEWLARIPYGNGEVGGDRFADDPYWLVGPLEISAREQVTFLESLLRRETPFRDDVEETVIDVMALDRGPERILHGKTGWTTVADLDLGWFVGWLEANGDTWVLALNLDMTDPDRHRGARRRIAERALEAVGAGPSGIR